MDTFANMDTTVDKNTPYINRLWITTALSLRFNDALTYREIAEQLNISTSATHKMFKRFRRTGINWSLSEKYTPERLEEEIPVPVQEPGSGKTRTARLWVCVWDDRNAGSQLPPAVWFTYSPDRKGIHPQQHLAGYIGILQADA